MVRLYHPELDATIEVSESAATVHMKKGWVQPDDPSPAEAPAEESFDEPHDSEQSSGPRRRN